jgi:4-azaleucine resistance transporter AzlC
MTPAAPDLAAARRELIRDMAGIAAGAAGFGIVYGLAARTAGLSPIEAMAMSVLVFAGSAQFAAVGLLAAGAAWPLIVLTTLLLNLRHVFYSAALRLPLGGQRFAVRAAIAHVLTDEAFALASLHFRRLGRVDVGGYWLAAIGAVFIPWNAATLIGSLGGAIVTDPRTLAFDVVFPAAMAGIAVALISGRRELIAAAAGVVVGVAVAALVDVRVGLVAGGLIGPLVAMTVPSSTLRDGNERTDEVPPVGPTP